jgi:tRNA (guanine6-N2)-methyltransferase
MGEHRRGQEPLYYAMTMPGLESVAMDEIEARVSGAESVALARGIALFWAAAAPRRLLDLRTTEDVFVAIANISGLGRGPEALRVLHAATERADLFKAIGLWKQARGKTPNTWRAVSQQAGEHGFRRVDAGRAVGDALRDALPRSLHRVEDDADLEFWLWLHESRALVGLRLSDATMRHRRYKREHLPASLRPTVAAALGWLSAPDPHDVVVDPLCGAGTIVIERGLLGPAGRLIGGDVRPQAVEMARRNGQSAGVRAEWRVWDARALPLDDASVTAIITNLPFGHKVGTPAENAVLYPTLARELARVTASGGRCVALAGDVRSWRRALHETGWQVQRQLHVIVLGQPANIFVARKS